MSTNDKKFESKDELEAWLKQQEVEIEEDDVGAVAEKLFANKFHKESRLRNITIQELAKYAGIEGPVARELSNKLSNDQQQVSQSNHPHSLAFVRSFASLSHSSTRSTRSSSSNNIKMVRRVGVFVFLCLSSILPRIWSSLYVV